MPTALKTGNFDLRFNANVVEILKQDNKVTGVKYLDTLSGEEFIQPASVVVLTSYVFNNAKLLMVSKYRATVRSVQAKARSVETIVIKFCRVLLGFLMSNSIRLWVQVHLV